MHFDTRVADANTHGVFAVSPAFGNDSALIAVFEHPGAAMELANVLNRLVELSHQHR